IEPRWIGARHFPRLCEHRRDAFREGFDRTTWYELRGFDPCRDSRRRHIFYVDAREHRGASRKDVAAFADEAILVLDQQPLLIGRRAYERERALQFLASQEEAELAILDLRPEARLRFLSVIE